MHPNAELLQRFYTAFQQRDGEAMAACYHPEATFTDPAFPGLTGQEPGFMWRMLCERADDLSIRFDGIEADETKGKAHWEADYTFSTTGRFVKNVIDAEFTFRDGLIHTHVDTFDFWTWSRQALGLPGLFLGWSPFLRNKVSGTAKGQLARYIAKRTS